MPGLLLVHGNPAFASNQFLILIDYMNPTLSGRFAHLAALLLLPSILLAQPAETSPEDSIATYKLGEVVVSGTPDKPVTTGTVQDISFATISRTDQPTAATIAREIPAARVQTNSRGEALLYLRGAAERQIGIFLDGALINIPWDNRIDLSLVPLQSIGGTRPKRFATINPRKLRATTISNRSRRFLRGCKAPKKNARLKWHFEPGSGPLKHARKGDF